MDSIVLGVAKSQTLLSNFHTHTSGPAQFRNAVTTVESSPTLGLPWSSVLFLFYVFIFACAGSSLLRGLFSSFGE